MIFSAEPHAHTTTDRVRMGLHTASEAPARARTELHRLSKTLSPACLEIVELVLSELVTNAVRHAGADEHGALGVEVECGRTAVRVTVTDPGPGFDPAKRGGPRGADGGWGLYVVGEIAERWWVERAPNGTRVIAEIARS